MAAELPEAGMVTLCVAIGKAMAAELPEAGMVALCVAIGCAVILRPLLSFLEGSPARGPALDAAVIFVVFTVVMAYIPGVILPCLVTLTADIPVVLAAFRLFLVFVYALLLFVAGSLFHLLPAAGSNTAN